MHPAGPAAICRGLLFQTVYSPVTGLARSAVFAKFLFIATWAVIVLVTWPVYFRSRQAEKGHKFKESDCRRLKDLQCIRVMPGGRAQQEIFEKHRAEITIHSKQRKYSTHYLGKSPQYEGVVRGVSEGSHRKKKTYSE